MLLVSREECLDPKRSSMSDDRSTAASTNSTLMQGEYLAPEGGQDNGTVRWRIWARCSNLIARSSPLFRRSPGDNSSNMSPLLSATCTTLSLRMLDDTVSSNVQRSIVSANGVLGVYVQQLKTSKPKIFFHMCTLLPSHSFWKSEQRLLL